MHKRKTLLALLAAVALNAYAVGADPAIRFSSQITFGDSLSDVGSYAVGAVRQLGGGKFTINGDNTAINPALTGKNWTEVTAATLGLPAPCAAQTGLQGDPAQGFSVPVENHPGCFGYAQGGSRVTNPIGPGNAATGSPLGELTVPVAQQIASHLALAGGRFHDDEVVFVMAGGNDALAQLTGLASGAVRPRDAVAAMIEAAADLANLVLNQIVANGANHVVVNNLPDLADSPAVKAESKAVRAIAVLMVKAFNERLRLSLAREPRVLLVNVWGITHDQVNNPARYGLTNTTSPACGPNPLGGSSLVCNISNVLPGVDVSHYMYADDVHPTPFENAVIAQYVLDRMAERGWR